MMRVRLLAMLLLGGLLSIGTGQGQVVLSEFQAANVLTLVDEDGSAEDWLEIFNPTAAAVDLGGWYLTDDPTRRTLWEFPSTNLGPGKFLVVFASGKDRRVPGRPLHTDFKLTASGEYLALIEPDGVTAATEFAPVYPPQPANTSYGLPVVARRVTLLAVGASGKFQVPSNDAAGLDWIDPGFDDMAWTTVRTGVGFDAANSLTNLMGSQVGEAMRGTNASAYLRLPFVADASARLEDLMLRIRYNDGFLAYLNGRLVATRNAPVATAGGTQTDSAADWSLMGQQGFNNWCDSCTFAVTIDQEPSAGAVWNSSATATRTAEESVVVEEIDLTIVKDLVVSGTNVLALHGLNATADDPNFLLLPELIGTYRGMDVTRRVYFTQPTPGAANGPGSTIIGPIISDVQHAPLIPADGDDIVVTARITPALRPVGGVTLKYRVMYGVEASVPMFDDGQHGDGAAGDAWYAARIPANASKPGQMVRYFIVATDTLAQTTRTPLFAEPKRSPQYFGTVVWDPALTNSQLPVLHWFIANPASADSDVTARCSLFFDGEFYDNVGANIHGQSTRDFPKKSYDLDFNPGYKFRWSDNAPRVDDLNLLTTWADKAHMRNVLAYETYRDAGAPSHFAFPIRVQRNGAFFSVANLVENGDENQLKRLGLDPRGAYYKMYNAAESTVGAEKKSRKQEGTADLQALITGMRQSTAAARERYLYDNLNLPEIIDFLAARIITADTDCCHKNYYLYRDSEGTGEWQIMPWDVDLSFGRAWTCGSPCLAYFDQTIYTNQGISDVNGNRVITPFFDTVATRQMYLRRLRTLMDALLQPPGTPTTNDLYRLKTQALRDRIAPDAARDLAAWGTWGARETITQAVDRIWNEFLPGRRAFLFRTMSVTNRGEIPLPQPTNAIVQLDALEYRPASGNPLQEWLSITNANSYAVDISEWRLEGAVRFAFKSGTVIPARSVLFVSPDVKAFRARTLTPKGGERRFVVGPYEGNLSAWGETLVLLDAAGRTVSSRSYTGNPSDAQRYLRVTEIHYNPAPLPNEAGWDAQQFEYIELRNIGSAPLDLTGVCFTEGVQFEFSTGNITNLAAGARLFLARNTNAFAFRYGADLPLAGQFSGGLDNAGERLRLEDRFGEKVLDFSYDNRWYPATEGHGFSLAIVDDTLPWEAWGVSTNWFAALSLVDGPPVAGADGLLVLRGDRVSVAASTLLANDIDPEGEAVTITGVISPSHYGATVTLVAGQVSYHPAPAFVGNDWFTYQIANTRAQKAEGRVDVLVYTGILPAAHQLTFVPVTDGYRLRYRGTPNQQCELQRSVDLIRWATVLDTAMPPYGIVEYLEQSGPSAGAYYRALQR